VTIEKLEEDLSSYVRRGNLTAQRIATIDPEAYGSYTAMQRAALSEGEANYYLGDLLLHTDRENDAERYLKQAVALDPDFIPSYASLGVLYVRKGRYAEAKKYLQKATSSHQSALVHYFYDNVLSRENLSANGRISSYTPENAAVMREQLLRSIKLDPDYAGAPYLLALVDLVRNERLDEAVEMAQKAWRLEPSRTGYALLLAQIYMRRSEPALARQILERLTNDSDQSVKAEAQELLQSLNENRSGASPGRSSPPAVNTSRAAEPVPAGTSRMLGGESGSVTFNDGQIIKAADSSLDEVLAKFVEAMGGVAAIDKTTSRVIRGELNVVGVSRGGSFETQAQAPNKVITTAQAYPVGTVKTAFNGRTGWARTAAGLRTLKNFELASIQRDADFYGQFRPKKLYPKMTLAGMSKIGYREVYVLDLEPGQTERIYLDAKTYLPVRSNVVMPLGAKSVLVEIYMDDWREVDGIKYPFYMSQKFPGLTLTYTVKEIKHNEQIDPKVFEP
jgi:hypothetical protein